MCKVSCDICKFSSPHDYVPNHYYCNKGLFFNDKEPMNNCEDGEIDNQRYKNKYGISYIMSQFNDTVSKINELKNQEKMIIENFENSTGELSKVFHCILEYELEGVKSVCLSATILPESGAKELKDMGFEIEEYRDNDKIIRGYFINWE